MKELFTKSFWGGVKRTFDEAREDLPSGNKVATGPAEVDCGDGSTSESPASCSAERAPGLPQT
jgi:hypothetical protein